MATDEFIDEADELFAATVEDLPISSLSTDRVVDAPGSISIADAARTLDDEAIGLLVLRDDDGALLGVVSERDVVRAVARGADLDSGVAAISSGDGIQWAEPTAMVADVAAEMMRSYVRHVLVAGKNGDVDGIVSVRDLLAVLAR